MSNGESYVTYFDQRYLARAIVMLRSLRRMDPEAIVFALCFDQVSFDIIFALNDSSIQAIMHERLLDFEPRLNMCTTRTRNAFFATHKPALPLYVLAHWPDLKRVTHVDADIMFFSSPACINREMGDWSIVLSPHRYPVENTHWENYYGRFNAGFISWRNDDIGRTCLNDYLEDCLDRVEPNETDGKFMNQGYLSDWPERYDRVHILTHPGVNLAPWNVASHRLTNRHLKGLDLVQVDGVTLVFYHFSRMFRDPDGYWRTDYVKFGEENLTVALLKIYQPYFREVDAIFEALNQSGVVTLTMELPPNWMDMLYVN